MRIKVAFLEMDSKYLNKVVSALNEKFSNHVEASSFTNPKYLIEYLNENRNAVVLAKEGLPIDFSKIPSETSFAYLVEAYGVAECNGQKAICKYQMFFPKKSQITIDYKEKKSQKM